VLAWKPAVVIHADRRATATERGVAKLNGRAAARSEDADVVPMKGAIDA